MKEKIKNSELELGLEDNLAVDRFTQGTEKIQDVFGKLTMDMIKSLEPAVNTVALLFEKFAPALKPAIEFVGKFANEFISIAGELIPVVISGIASIVEWVGDWGKAFSDTGGNWITVEDTIVFGFKTVGLAGALAFDTIVYAVGGLAVAFGLITKGLGYVIDGFYQLTSLASYLPDDLRPQWVDDLNGGIKATSEEFKQAGRDVTAWGEKQMDGFGSSYDFVDKKIDQARAKAKKDREDAAYWADFFNEEILEDDPFKNWDFAEFPDEKKKEKEDKAADNKSITSNSMELANLTAKLQSQILGNDRPGDNWNKQQLDQARKTTDAVETVGEILKGMTGNLVAV